jgi:hypothetical protein
MSQKTYISYSNNKDSLYKEIQRIFLLLSTKIRYNTIWKTLIFYLILQFMHRFQGYFFDLTNLTEGT